MPGLGNNAADYTTLANKLRRDHGFIVEVAPVSRLDWARNAKGLLDRAYWTGNLQPRPTVDWYLDRVALALETARNVAPDNAPVTLLAHSAGGWLGRLFMLEAGPSNVGVDRFLSLGSPHQPPPKGVVDQTRGILSWVSEKCPGAFHCDVEYVTVAGRYIRGAPLSGPGTWQRRIVGAGYKQVCGIECAWGDGVVPVPAAHLDGAMQLTLNGVYHSPLGASNDESSGEYAVDVATRVNAAESSSADEGRRTHNQGDHDSSTPGREESSSKGPRRWYGSAGVLEQWVHLLRSSDEVAVEKSPLVGKEESNVSKMKQI